MSDLQKYLCCLLGIKTANNIEVNWGVSNVSYQPLFTLLYNFRRSLLLVAFCAQKTLRSLGGNLELLKAIRDKLESEPRYVLFFQKVYTTCINHCALRDTPFNMFGDPNSIWLWVILPVKESDLDKYQAPLQSFRFIGNPEASNKMSFWSWEI